MDTTAAKLKVESEIDEIKRFMPETYLSIQAKAREVGNQAYEWVRRGLRGEPNYFYAMEGGRVKGEPFNRSDIMPEISKYMVQFGCSHIVVWASEGVIDGTH
jgi:hypothetical protein